MNRIKKMTLIVVAGMMLTVVPAALAQQETSPDQFLGAGESSAQVTATVQKAKLANSKQSKTQRYKASAYKSNGKRRVLVAKR
jgi:uncharacterized protein YxeA